MGVVQHGSDVNVLIGEFGNETWPLQVPRKLFRILCSDVAEVKVELGRFEDAAWVQEHPALWKHNQAQSNLYFSSAPPDPYAVVATLSQVHAALYAGYRSMADDFNTERQTLGDLLAGGHGLLASGPIGALEQYAANIEKLMKVNIVDGWIPKGEYGILGFHEGCFIVCKSAELADDPNLPPLPVAQHGLP
jgi:hypothetical protein